MEVDAIQDVARLRQAYTYILIGSEVLKVTAVSTNALTVIRGQDGTTATTHLDAAKVFLLKSNVKLTSTEPYAQPRVETTINEGAAFAKTDTTLTVTSGTTLGAVANTYISIGSEVLMLVTAALYQRSYRDPSSRRNDRGRARRWFESLSLDPDDCYRQCCR